MVLERFDFIYFFFFNSPTLSSVREKKIITQPNNFRKKKCLANNSEN